MKNWLHRNWWIIIPIMLLFPFGVNWLINLNTPLWWSGGVVGEGRDWLLFWGAYISSIATAMMAFLTYRIIKQNEDSRQGVIGIRLRYIDKVMYGLELMNVGNSAVYNIQMSMNENFLKLLSPRKAEAIKTISKSKIYLKPNESKIIALQIYSETAIPTGDECPTKEQLELIKTTTIEIRGSYKSIGKTFPIEETFCINDWTGLFLNQETILEREISKISKSITGIEKKIK